METRDDVLIRGLWEQHTDATIDAKPDNAEANNYMFKPMDKLLAVWVKKNKDNNGKHCHDKWKHFPLFFLSVDGLLS